MPQPLDAPKAVSVVAEPLEDLLADVNHVPSVELLPVVPVAGTASSAPGWLTGVAQAVYDAGAGAHLVRTAVRPYGSPGAWREVLRREVAEGFMQPTSRYASAEAPSADLIRSAGELAEGIADLVEAHLGPVRIAADVDGPHAGDLAWRNVLLVTDGWATILHLGIRD
ncbi:hypothetical protein AB0G79_13830 [Streptomyces sp. NPDC020807]|uniref:hypothetical protein n=1 Tax=Streptomyces sp. NPDC020807 TaxID=3155119 RepID=UPI00340E817D